MGLRHVVITSVDRDDLPNGGAEAFAGCITEIRRRLPETSVEVLIPDFKGIASARSGIVMDARPDILNHNLETVERLYRLARPGGRYDAGARAAGDARQGLGPTALTKSGIILGMGEEWDEVLAAMRDLRAQRREHPHAGPVPPPLGRPPAGGALLHARRIRRAARHRPRDGIPPRRVEPADPLELSRLGAGASGRRERRADEGTR